MTSCKSIWKTHRHPITTNGIANRSKRGGASIIFLCSSSWEFYTKNVLLYICNSKKKLVKTISISEKVPKHQCAISLKQPPPQLIPSFFP